MEGIKETVQENGPDIQQVRYIDMASQPSIQSFADKLSAEVERIDGFVANAGVLLDSWSTVEGMEASVQVNVVNTLLLGTLILPKLSAVARELGIQPTLVFIVSVLGYTAKSELDKSRDGNIFEGLNDQKKANMSSRLEIDFLRVLKAGYRPLTRQLSHAGTRSQSSSRSWPCGSSQQRPLWSAQG